MILIAGCGYVGGRLADLLHEAGHTVHGLTHSADSAERLADTKPWAVHACDISSPAAVAALAATLGADAVRVVVHCASSNRGGEEVYRTVYQLGMSNLLDAFPGAKPVFTSSSSVYAQTDGTIVTEDSPAEPDRKTGCILRHAEELVLAAPGGVVARLTGIYGPGRSFVLKNLLEGRATIEGNAGEGRSINQIHQEDAAAAIAHLIGQDLTGIFNVCDDLPTTQHECFLWLCPLFNLPLPPVVPADKDRKRGWTHKKVSNARLKASGWAPRYPSYQAALANDPLLVPSILELVQSEEGSMPRSPNIVVIGLMGCGKSSVGRIVANMIGFKFVDTDQLICEEAGCGIPKIFEKEGEAGFRLRESAALRSLLGRRGHVIATGGGIVTQPHNLPLLRHLGYVVWLDASVTTLHRRTFGGHDRPLLNDEDPKARLERLMASRKELYKGLADQRITTDNLTLQETSYGVAESARVWFANLCGRNA
ncbi:MAG: Shikimate kinase [Verrucomicrobiaceae bacterium]|nr:Shikimate kinase [Verrucomicrobiaceae bacterium]